VKFDTILYKALEIGDGLVHQIVQDRSIDDNGDTMYGYRVICSYAANGLIHIYEVDKPVTCLACLATSIHPRCHRAICDAAVPADQMYQHRDTFSLFCAACAALINTAEGGIVLPRWK
jgi:hypothetical protein